MKNQQQPYCHRSWKLPAIGDTQLKFGFCEATRDMPSLDAFESLMEDERFKMEASYLPDASHADYERACLAARILGPGITVKSMRKRATCDIWVANK